MCVCVCVFFRPRGHRGRVFEPRSVHGSSSACFLLSCVRQTDLRLATHKRRFLPNTGRKFIVVEPVVSCDRSQSLTQEAQEAATLLKGSTVIRRWRCRSSLRVFAYTRSFLPHRRPPPSRPRFACVVGFQIFSNAQNYVIFLCGLRRSYSIVSCLIVLIALSPSSLFGFLKILYQLALKKCLRIVFNNVRIQYLRVCRTTNWCYFRLCLG